jgi:hypothetical protein
VDLVLTAQDKTSTNCVSPLLPLAL